MRNVTISMDDAALTRVRVEAAKAGLSVSKWIARQVGSAFEGEDRKAAASQRIEQLLDEGLKLPLSQSGQIRIDRDELYGDRFRRFDHPALSAGPEQSAEGARLTGVAETPEGPGPAGDEPAGSE